MGWDATRGDGDCKKKWLYEEEEDDDDDESSSSCSDSDCSRTPTPPPDGGWGWLVMLGSFLCHLVVDGICFSFGLDIPVYMKEFNASHYKVSWIGSALSGCYLLVGPFASALCSHYGCRKVTMVGSLVAMFGFALSTQATNVETMIICYGVIGGIGFGLIYLPAIVSVGHWFDKKRAFATGIAVGGSGFGQIIFPPVTGTLMVAYRWQGRNLIMAGVVLNCLVCGALFRPVKRWLERRRKPVNSRVEIERGVIMKALIEHKEKQRTISNGSLDDCVITRDNKLIKLDPALLDCKRNNSMLARFKRQLGFSAQSLSKSKSSFTDMQKYVLGAFNSRNNSTTILHGDLLPPPPHPSLPQQQLKSPQGHGSSTPDVYICESHALGLGGVGTGLPTLVLNGTAIANNGGVARSNNGVSPGYPPPGFPKTRSCDALSRQAQLAEEASPKGVNGTCSMTDLPSTPIPPCALSTSLISIKVVPNGRGSRQSVRQRSSRSVCSEYTPSTAASSHPTFVSASVTSMPQIQYDLDRQDSISGKMCRVLCDMFDVKLLNNPMFALLVVSSVFTLFAFNVPYFYLPEQGLSIGMMESEANFLLTIMGVANTIGRFFGGWLADRPVVNALCLNNFSLTLSGFCIIVCPYCEGVAFLCVMAGCSAFFFGIFIALRSIILVEILGLDMLTKSFGMLILFQGISALVGPPIAGELADRTGNLTVCFTLAGALIVVSGWLFFPIQYLHSKSKKGQQVPAVRDGQINETYCIGKIVSEA